MRLTTLIFTLPLVIFAQESLPPPYRVIQNGVVKITSKLASKPKSPLTIGDRVRVRVVITHPRNVQVTPPFVEEHTDFIITDQTHTIRYQGDTIAEVYDFTLAIFNTGEVKLPPFITTYQDVGGTIAVASESLVMSVKSLLSEKMSDIHDLKPQVNFPNLLPLWVLLGAAALGGMLFFGIKFYQHYRRQQIDAGGLALTPWEEALKALDAIPVTDWLQRGQIKRYYYTVSEIIKRYLTRRFGFPAIDQTTTEILRELKSRRLPESERFGAFFLTADLVKYAKHIPDQPERLTEIARELVLATRLSETNANRTLPDVPSTLPLQK